MQLALNEAFDRRSINLLIAISKINRIDVSGEGVLDCASLISADLVSVRLLTGTIGRAGGGPSKAIYQLALTEKGKLFMEAWQNGDQEKAVTLI